ncbi:unnamed protein product [Rotaria sordida]|uniref:Uncharacterized protein n=1 Tax=Rotaria sordida TaxID=392033 RepID=A0A815ELD6_9BILA|nr:unnamed protein product [Rotaria sordida]CAF1313568.1 unnamed protein product [Rotaria sordida]
MICPAYLVDLNKAGSVYLVKHKSKTEEKENDCDKATHFGLAIDVTAVALTGSSTSDKFIATHIDLYIHDETDHTTYIDSTFNHREWHHYQLIKKVGQISINDIRMFHSPMHFAKNLEHRLIFYIFNPMCQQNQGAHWSSTLNCQTFTRLAIEYLGYEFPPDVKIISDCVPTMINIYMKASLLTAHTKEKSYDKLSS